MATALIAAAATAPAASAALTPSLSSSNPASPGASTTPRIRGDADGIITSGVGTSAFGPIAMAIEPDNLITLYTDNKCTGPVAAEGTAAELEGVGILVTVPPDSETTFHATQTDEGGGVSTCSSGFTYQQVSTPPDPPVFSATDPASPANQNLPRLIGTVAAKSIVTIFDTPGCSGNQVASGTAVDFSGGGIQVQVADNSTTTFYGVATLAGISSACSSSSISYQEVTPAEPPPGGGGNPGGGTTNPPPSNGKAKPAPPRLRTVPGGVGRDLTPTLTGVAPGAVSVRIFDNPTCQGPALAKGSVAQFSAAGFELEIVPNTTVAFWGASVDSDGDQSLCSDPVVYTHDSIAPKTRITVGPAFKTVKKTVVFRFADLTGGLDTKFLCKVDKKKWKACKAPLKLKHLGHRRHTLRVKAYDGAGNRETKGAKRKFQVVKAF
ncbi:MAG TPA: hypothetical protein VHR18_08420 [Solirubrobacterales bacterium]|nr:hypothetical protein [Solirubrobacterales bacterium]